MKFNRNMLLIAVLFIVAAPACLGDPVNPPAGLKQIFYEDFESTASGQLPAGWTQVDFNDAAAASDPLAAFTVWGALTYDELAAQGDNRVNVPVIDGNSLYHESDRIDPYLEAHLFSPVLDLSKYKNIVLTFNSAYMQNQDNIGAVEYNVDGGSMSAAGEVKGKWLPIVYMLDDKGQTADVKYNADGSIDGNSTFAGIADGTSFAYGDLTLAAQSSMTFSDMAPFISGRINDDNAESKRSEQYRLEMADNQSQVVISWLNMGTGSWFWAIDDVAIWGIESADASEWPIFFEDFESTPSGQLPSGWTQVNFNDAAAASDPLAAFTVWGAVTYDELAAQGDNRVNVPIINGNSLYHESDRIDPYVEAHLFSPVLDLSNIKNVELTFNSSYIQNQDNIGAVEYNVDGGSLSASGEVTGKWLPIVYMLDDKTKTADVKYNADGSIDGDATFSGIADGTSFAYGDLTLAAQSGMSFSEMAPYISGRINDDNVESKRSERYRLEKADNQSKVVISWLNMGTGSWFWAIDEVAIWGIVSTDVSEWPLY
ncbi:MAG: hypothetical protein AB1656_05955 [Candidatus Omnitrophota bacterium]